MLASSFNEMHAKKKKSSDQQSVQDWSCFERILETFGKIGVLLDLWLTFHRLTVKDSTCMCCMLSYATVDRMPAIIWSIAIDSPEIK